MKNALLAASLLLLGGRCWAQKGGSFGAGVVAGDPTGGTVKYWLDGDRALDAGVGFSGDAALYADFLWHYWDILPQPTRGRLGLYAGLGPRIETQRETAFGIRTLLGAAYWVPKHPIELFVDAGPVFQLAPDRGVDVDFAFGVRFYFR